MVHEGPIKICETFLSVEERGKYPEEQVLLLESVMKKFIKLAGFAVKLANLVIKLRELNEYVQFQEMIDNHYCNMRENMKQFLSSPPDSETRES